MVRGGSFSSAVFLRRVHHFSFFLTAISRAPPVLRSIFVPFRLYLANSLVSAITYLTPKFRPELVFPHRNSCEKRTCSLAGVPDATRPIRSSLIQPLLRSRRNSWLIRPYSAERICFTVISTVSVSSNSDSHISAFRKKISLLCVHFYFL